MTQLGVERPFHYRLKSQRPAAFPKRRVARLTLAPCCKGRYSAPKQPAKGAGSLRRVFSALGDGQGQGRSGAHALGVQSSTSSMRLYVVGRKASVESASKSVLLPVVAQ